MRCPDCGSNEFDNDGFCLRCGFCITPYLELDERHDPEGEWALSPEHYEVLTQETDWSFLQEAWQRSQPDTGAPEDFYDFEEFSEEVVYNPCNPASEDNDYLECTWED